MVTRGTSPHPPSASAFSGSGLELREVSKHYVAESGSVVAALDRFTLSVRGGEIVALIGPSGCGKSTLLRLIAGLDPASGGELRIGEDVITGPAADRTGAGRRPVSHDRPATRSGG